MLRRITQANRWVSFDIEVDYVPHERKDERITMIGVTLFDHAHSVPLEHRLFARVADRRIAHDSGAALPARGDIWRVGSDVDCDTVRAMDLAPVAELCRKTVLGAKAFRDINMVLGVSFEVIHATSEYTMLKQFVQYIRNARVSGVCYFNGHKFDMPFAYARLSVLSAAAGDNLSGDPVWVRSAAVRVRRPSASSTTTSTTATTTAGAANEEPTQRISLTHRQDQVQIRYKFKRPSPDHRKSGISLRARSINEQRDALVGERAANEDGEDNDSDDGGDGNYCDGDVDATLGDAVAGHDGTEFIPISFCETTAPDGQQGVDGAAAAGTTPMFDASAVSDVTAATAPVNPMLAARTITTLSMMNVALLDVMLEVGDRNRGCRLDVASERLLGINKVHDERVTYANLTRTFTHGNVADLQVAYGYCMMDVIITMMLLKVKKIEPSYMADTTISGSQPRELYTSEMVKSTVNTMYQYGYWANILTSDVTHSRDERHSGCPATSSTPSVTCPTCARSVDARCSRTACMCNT